MSVPPDAPTGRSRRTCDGTSPHGQVLGTGVRIGRGAAECADGSLPRRRLLITRRTTFVVDAANAARAAADPGGVLRPGLSSDGRRAALGGFDGGVAILDLRTGERRTLGGRLTRIGCARWRSAPMDARLRSAGDGRVLVWDLRSGEVRETLTGHTGAVNSLKFSDDGHTLYTGGLDGRIIVWDIAGDRRLARPFRAGDENSGYPPPLAISPSGRTVAAGLSDGGVRLHDARTLRRLRDLPGIEDRPVRPCRVQPRRSIDRRDGHVGPWSYATQPPAAACARRCAASAHRRRRWHVRPMAAASQ